MRGYQNRSSTPPALKATWTAGPTAITALSGALTTAACVSASKKTGKTVDFQARITITTNGTGATGLQITLPFAPVRDSSFHGMEIAGTNKQVCGRCLAAATALTLFFSDGTYPGADGRTIVVSGTYETA